MHTHIQIICSNKSVPALNVRLTDFESLIDKKWDVSREIQPYWKDADCSVLMFDFFSDQLDLVFLKDSIAKLSGTNKVDILEQNSSAEISSYCSILDMHSGSNIAFVVCYVTY